MEGYLLLIKFYTFLLHLYPRSYREEFSEEMLLDFSDLAVDARKKGVGALTFFCLRELIDFPVSLLKAYLSWGTAMPSFRPGAGRNILRIAFAFGLVLALDNFTGILTFAKQSYFTDIEQFAHSANWQGTPPDIESIILSSSDLILGPILVAIILLVVFPEMRPVKRYLPVTALVFALPTVLVDLRLTVLKNLDLPFKDTIFALVCYILIGLGFGMVASMISREHRKTPWLLLVGSVGYFLTTWASNILILRSYHEHSVVFWRAVASVSMRNALMGVTMGLLLGIVLEFKRRDDPPGFPSVHRDSL